METNRQRVIITGASSGIGLDAAKRFLAGGASVVLSGKDEAKLRRVVASLDARGRVVAVSGDVGDPATGKRLADAAREHLGGADVLVNSAGVFDGKPFLEVTAADLTRFFDTNLKGTYFVTQAVVPLLVEAGGGAIVNLGTVFVDQPLQAMPASAAVATKGAVHALTRSLAIELAPHHIRVNAVAPGIIRTPLIGDAADSLASIHPLKRVGEVNETSDAILYLANARFVTGTILEMDGGYAHGR